MISHVLFVIPQSDDRPTIRRLQVVDDKCIVYLGLLTLPAIVRGWYTGSKASLYNLNVTSSQEIVSKVISLPYSASSHARPAWHKASQHLIDGDKKLA
jgi:hypothetical protein